MAVVKELIRTEENQSISFGNYELPQKSKVSDFAHQGDMYKVKMACLYMNPYRELLYFL